MDGKLKSSHNQELAVTEGYSGFHGKLVSRSGAGSFKGDAELRVTARLYWMVECKTTSKEYMAVRRDWWEKLALESVIELKDPMLEIEFGGYKFAGYDIYKFQELLELSKLPKPIQLMRRVYESNPGSGQVILRSHEMTGLARGAGSSGKVPAVEIRFKTRD